MAHDPLLTALAVLIAVTGARVGLGVLNGEGRSGRAPYKRRLLLSALAIGGAIWTMHFIAMFAMETSLITGYALAPSLAALFAGVILIAFGLFFADHDARWAHAVAATVLGVGAAAAHFIAIAAIRGPLLVLHGLWPAVLAVALGVAVAGIALIAMRRGSQANRLHWAALSLGAAISGMHYLAMAGLHLTAGPEIDRAHDLVIGTEAFAIVIALLAFAILFHFVLVVLPGRTARLPVADAPPDAVLSVATTTGLRRVTIGAILSVRASDHYAELQIAPPAGGAVDRVFSTESFASFRDRLAAARFLRTHRSHLVNPEHIREIVRQGDGGQVRFAVEGAEPAPISRSRWRGVVDALARPSRDRDATHEKEPDSADDVRSAH